MEQKLRSRKHGTDQSCNEMKRKSGWGQAEALKTEQKIQDIF